MDDDGAKRSVIGGLAELCLKNSIAGVNLYIINNGVTECILS